MICAGWITGLIFTILFFGSTNLKAQTRVSSTDIIRIDSLNALASQLIKKDNERALYFAQMAMAASKRLNYTRGLADASYNMGDYYYYLFKKDSALYYYRMSSYLSEFIEYKLRKALCEYSIAHILFEVDKYDDALHHAQEAIDILEVLGDSTRLAKVFNLVCGIYNYKGQNEKAIDFCIRCIDMFEKLGELNETTNALNVIGNIYIQFRNYDKAEKHLREALDIAKKFNDLEQQSVSYSSLAEMHYSRKEFHEALSNYQMAYDLDVAEKDTFGLAYATYAMGKTYLDLEEVEDALQYLGQSLVFSSIRQDNDLLANSYAMIGKAYHLKGNSSEALDFLNKSLSIAQEINAYPILHTVYKIFAEYHERSGYHKDALQFYKLYMEYDDKMKLEENSKRIAEADAKYELGHKEKMIEVLIKENEVQMLLARQRDLVNKGLLAFVFFTLMLAMILLNRNNIKNKANKALEGQKEAINQQKAEIEQQRDEIQQKNLALAEFNKQMTDSIEYARRIQLSLFPNKNELKQIFPESFVFNKPKDIISGDFYWVTTHEDKIFLAVVDCTGHGVPGAFMTILACSLLNQIILENHIFCPNMALSLLDIKVKQNLHLNELSSPIADGMDMGLCVIDKNERIVEFAGAKFCFYYSDGTQLCQVNGNRYPIGSMMFPEKNFTSTKIRLPENTTFYLATDGFQDQFGGPGDSKFMKPNFRKLLASMISYPINEQHMILTDKFQSWKGGNPQTDDIIVLGVRI
jgi:serine phosphatase RsbU (regulator of sigma subunit)/tetratricopeptide (TPR) repeat protein